MKIKLAVMFGGRSVEHEISVISAIQAIGAVNKEKYEVIPIYITKNNEMYVGEHIGDIEAYKNISKLLSESTRVNLISDEGHALIVKYPHKAFSKAVIEFLDVIDFIPDVIHCNDWQSGPVCVYLRDIYKKFVSFSNIKTLFTIHNSSKIRRIIFKFCKLAGFSAFRAWSVERICFKERNCFR